MYLHNIICELTNFEDNCYFLITPRIFQLFIREVRNYLKNRKHFCISVNCNKLNLKFLFYNRIVTEAISSFLSVYMILGTCSGHLRLLFLCFLLFSLTKWFQHNTRLFSLVECVGLLNESLEVKS